MHKIIVVIFLTSFVFVTETSIAEDTPNRYITDLKSNNVSKRLIAAQKLGDYRDEEVIDALVINGLKDKEVWVRRNSLMSLGKIQAKKTLGSILKCLKDEDPGVRETTCEVLISLGDNTAVLALLEFLSESSIQDDWIAREYAIEVLSKTKDERILPCLKKLLVEDPNAKIRSYAAKGIGEIGKVDEETVKLLLTMIDDTNQWVRGEVVYALGRIGDISIYKVLHLIEKNDRYPEVRKKAKEGMEMIERRVTK
mgnify:CR=1